jgi:hypothetical protein
VKPGINIGKRLLALTLAMVYVFAMSTYIIFLSSRTHVHHHHHLAAAKKIQHLSGSAAATNFFDKQHGAFKTIRQNKPKVINSLYSLICVAVLALVFGAQLFNISYPNRVASGLMFAGRPCYLSLRVLRI